VRTTSTQRTYRYLRLAISGTVVVIFVAIAASIPRAGLLPSLSHYYYTPARMLFVAALITVSVCFLALSGRGVERALLDAAAVLAPLIAIVPTVIAPGSVPGVAVSCAGSCVPDMAMADVEVGIVTYLVVGVAVVALTVVLALTGEVDRRAGFLSSGIAAVVLLSVGAAWVFARPVFLDVAHLATAVGFFGLISAVAVVNAFWPSDRRMPPRWLRIAYVVIALAIILDVVGMQLFGWVHVGDVYGVFVGEVGALLLFVTFWILQTVQYWRADADHIPLRPER
jgi:hypothetical protein